MTNQFSPNDDGQPNQQYPDGAASHYPNQPGNPDGQPGGYASPPQSPHGGAGGGKKKTNPWVWVVVGVIAVALIVGGIFGGMALFGGNQDSTREADDSTGSSDTTSGATAEADQGGAGTEATASEDNTADDEHGMRAESIQYTGDYVLVGNVTTAVFSAVNEEESRFVFGISEYLESGPSDEQELRDAWLDRVNENYAPIDGEFTQLGETITLEDTNGVPLDFELASTGDGEGEGWAAWYVFPESGDAIVFVAGWAGPKESSPGVDVPYSKSDFEDFLKNDVEFTLTEE